MDIYKKSEVSLDEFRLRRFFRDLVPIYNERNRERI